MQAAARKLELLGILFRGRLSRPGEVVRLHETLCFMRAYPDNSEILARVESALGSFDRRGDLRRNRRALESSGIAGTDILYQFFAGAASWLARRWAGRLSIVWKGYRRKARLEKLLALLASESEAPGLDGWDIDVEEWIDTLRGPGETGAAFIIRRFDRIAASALLREILYEDLDLELRLRAGPDTPARTREKHRRSPVCFQSRPLARGRPSLAEAARWRPAGIRTASRGEARELIDLARGAMVARGRDLDAFTWAESGDVRLVDWQEGLQLVFIGAIPERRLVFEALYGYLILKNGVPIGYGSVSSLMGTSEVAYNVFETFRGVEASLVLARVVATARELFGADTFTIDPYQLGKNNEEALESGAWWFYWKLGFRPRDRGAVALMRRELARMRHRPGHRSSPSTLRRLASAPLYWFAKRPREDVLPDVYLPNVGLRITKYLSRRFGSARGEGVDVCAGEAARALGLRSLAGISPGERLAWRRWSPIVMLLPDLKSWSRPQRRALARVILAKGGLRESEFARLFDAHRRLRREVARLAREL